MERPGWPGNRESPRARLHAEIPAAALSRLLLQGFEGTRPGCADGANGLCRRWRNDRGFRAGRGAGAISRHRSEDVSRRTERSRLRKRPWTKYAEDFPGNGAI